MGQSTRSQESKNYPIGSNKVRTKDYMIAHRPPEDAGGDQWNIVEAEAISALLALIDVLGEEKALVMEFKIFEVEKVITSEKAHKKGVLDHIRREVDK